MKLKRIYTKLLLSFFGVLIITLLPFATGLLARYQVGDYDFWLNAHIFTGVNPGAQLAYDNGARVDGLAVAAFHA